MYLLINHGLCFENNRYDSLKLYLNLDQDKTPNIKSITTDQLLAKNLASGGKIQEIRLKMNQFNFELIAFMRFVYRPAFQNIEALTKVTDLEFEKFCIE